MTSVSAVHIVLTPTQLVGSGRPQKELNPGPPHQESHALPKMCTLMTNKNLYEYFALELNIFRKPYIKLRIYMLLGKLTKAFLTAE